MRPWWRAGIHHCFAVWQCSWTCVQSWTCKPCRCVPRYTHCAPAHSSDPSPTRTPAVHIPSCCPPASASRPCSPLAKPYTQTPTLCNSCHNHIFFNTRHIFQGTRVRKVSNICSDTQGRSRLLALVPLKWVGTLTSTREVYALLMAIDRTMSWPSCRGRSLNTGVLRWCSSTDNQQQQQQLGLLHFHSKKQTPVIFSNNFNK